MAEFVTATGCTVSVWYVPKVNFWDTPGIWLILRMIPQGPLLKDGRAASVLFTPGEAVVLATELERKGTSRDWVPLETGVAFRVFERVPEEYGPMPGIWLLLRKTPEQWTTIELVMTADEADTLTVALRYALQDAVNDA